MPGTIIELSEFDSDVFGLPFYRVLDADAGAVAEALKGLPSGPAVVDLKLPASDPDETARFAALGFRKASIMVEFEAPPLVSALPDPKLARTCALSGADLTAHAAGFRFQRFRQDGRLPAERSIDLMRRWIANSLAGRRETLAIGPNFCTFSADDTCLTIDLLSCIDQGQGMAKRLLTSFHAEGQARGATILRVTTEAENARAMHSYARAGFVPVRSYVAMHWIRQGAG